MKILFAFAALFAAAVQAAAPAGSIRTIVGTAQVNPALHAGWKAARAGMKLFTSDQVRTDPESSLEIAWENGGLLRIAEASVMTISGPADSLSEAAPGTTLLKGRIWANMKKIASTERKFGISTPTAVAAIRGTVFRVDAGVDSSTDVLVYEGKVAVGPGEALQKAGVRPPDSSGRREMEGPGEVEGPKEVTLQEWVTIVAGQQIRVERTGTFKTWQFDASSDSLDAWVKSNLERDKKMEKK